MVECAAENGSRPDLRVSFIVPAYNVSGYVERCVQSLQAVDILEMEIIVINDGSEDDTSEICRAFARHDARLRVHDQENRGLSEARNVGVALSRGRFVAFVDADDYIAPDEFEAALRDAEVADADVVVSGAIVVDAVGAILEERIPLPVREVFVHGREYMTAALGAGTLRMCAPYNIYARSLIRESVPPFLRGIYHEDELWTPQVLLAADRVITTKRPFYFHSVRTAGSIMSSPNAKARSADLLRVVKELDSVVDSLADPKLRAALDENRVSLFLSAIHAGRLQGRREAWSKPRWRFLMRAHSLRNRSRAMLYLLSPRLYSATNRSFKVVRASRKAKAEL